MSAISVVVVLALPDSATEIALTMPEGMTLLDAVMCSGIVSNHPQIGIAPLHFGIWGRHASPATILIDGDRVEIYRPLVCSPKLARSARASSMLKP